MTVTSGNLKTMNIKVFFIVASIAAIALYTAATAQAQEITPEQVPQTAEIKPVTNPKMEDVIKRAEKLSHRLSPAEVDNLALVRDGFGMIRSADLAQEAIEDAVKACAKANPDMAKAIKERHDSWEDAVEDEIDRQEDKLESFLTKDYFNNPDDIEDYLDSIKAAAKYAEKNIKKEVVTSKTACENLHKSLDETQEAITSMLADITWPDKTLSEAPE